MRILLHKIALGWTVKSTLRRDMLGRLGFFAMLHTPPLPSQPYVSVREHLQSELDRLTLLLRLHKLTDTDDAQPEKAELIDMLTTLSLQIRERLSLSDASGQTLPMMRLAQSLSLSDAEVRLVTLLLLRETEEAAQQILAPFFGPHPQGTVAHYLTLLRQQGLPEPQIQEALRPGSTLRRHGFLLLADDAAWAPTTPLLFQRLKLSDRLAAFLRGEDRPKLHTLPHGVSLYFAQRTLAQLTLPAGLLERVRDALHESAQPLLGDPDGPVLPPLCLTGLRRSGRKALLAALLPGRPLVVLSATSLLGERASLLPTVQAALGEAALQQGLLYIASAELLGELDPSLFEQLRRLLLGSRVRVVLAADGPIDALWMRLPDLLRIDFPMPDRATQVALWNSLLPVDMGRERGFDVRVLASHYSLPAGAIQRSASEIVNGARIDGGRRPQLTMAAAREAIRKQLGNRFGDLAQLVTTSLSWEDLVLPAEILDRVLEVVAYARYREQLLGKWGFERLLPYGRSISVLLAGAPGTGKTMAAALVAKEIGLELFRVNVARVVERFAGDTEKNLARIFDEAKRQQVALLFDEADTLFGKRLDVRSSQDRYANMAVSFLLQAVESHDGMLILTTNNEKLLDEAFKRRLRFRIALPLPSEYERAKMWQAMLPKDTPKERGVDFAALASEFDLSGGAIKNAVVRAALRALAQGGEVSQELLRQCAKLECEEMGILVTSDAGLISDADDDHDEPLNDHDADDESDDDDHDDDLATPTVGIAVGNQADQETARAVRGKPSDETS